MVAVIVLLYHETHPVRVEICHRLFVIDFDFYYGQKHTHTFCRVGFLSASFVFIAHRSIDFYVGD